MNTGISNCMILEEKISFFEEPLALEFKEWLATFGCKAKISTTFDYFTEDLITGTIDDIDKWCSEMSTGDQNQAPLYQNIKEKNADVKYAVQVILEGRSAGDVLYTKMDQKILDANLLSFFMENPSTNNSDLSSERFNDKIFATLPLSYIHLLFKDSNCISESGDKTILTQDIAPEEVINEITIDSLNLPERVEFPGLCNIFNYIPNTQYEVIFSLPSHMLMEHRILAAKLNELGVSQTDISTFIDAFSLKSQIVRQILMIIEENKVLSIKELKDKLRDAHLPGEDEWGHAILLIDVPVTQQFVLELRKAGYISGNDQKLRIPSKSGKKRKR